MPNKKIINTELLENVVNKSGSDKVSINDLMTAMNSGGFGLVMLIFSLPILIPMPPPFPSFIAFPLLIFSFQMMIGFSFPRLPKILSNFSIKRTVLATMMEKSNQYFAKASKILRRRMVFLTGGWFERVIGFLIFAFSLSILVPLPLTNLLPGIGIMIISFGLLGHDGLVILIGIAIGIIGIMATVITVFVGTEALILIKNLIVNLIF